MIDRYRKKGGFVQLLNLIETTGKDKQEKFLKMIAEESPIWETEVRKRLLTVDKILGWNPTYLAEIFPRVAPIQLAMLVGGLPPDKAEMFMKVLTYKEKRYVEETLKDKKPTPGETSSGLMKLFSEIRKMEAEGSLKFEKFDPDMVIPEEIEEKLGKGVAVFQMTPLSPSADQGHQTHSTANSGPSGGFSTNNSANGSHTSASLASASATGVPTNLAEELSTLRRKLVQLTQENHKLQQDNTTMKEKLEQIKKIA
ncbi:MAG: FliG C-terminal domain-containing protein, partial [Pseudobdellovibrionaceae bacterium]